MPGEPLMLCERVQIRVGLSTGENRTEIAARLGRAPSTVCREVARNGGVDGYDPVAAQDRAAAELARPRLWCFEADPELGSHVVARLSVKDSPMTIAVELTNGLYPEITSTVSHETIYDHVHAQGRKGLPAGLHKGLHRARRCRKHRRDSTEPDPPGGPLGDFNLISSRPAEADERTRVGHLEGDLITGAFNRTALVTVFDRTSRHLWLADFCEDHGAEATLAALVELLERIPEHLRLTLTWDQGREIARHADLARLVGIDMYIAEPHSPWQRPTNENGNGLIRRYVGKSTDLSVYTPDDLRAIETRINTMPRRSLNWSTAATVYAAAVAPTT